MQTPDPHHNAYGERFLFWLILVNAAILVLGAAFALAAPPRRHGPAVLNDLTLTPGAVGELPVQTLCSRDFHTGTVRNVPESLKQSVCRAYGIDKAHCNGKLYEIDHLISLELGGTNDQANLWPQPYFPRPGAKEKDLVENYLHRQVCSRAMTLPAAQKAIATDWFQVYLDAGLVPSLPGVKRVAR